MTDLMHACVTEFMKIRRSKVFPLTIAAMCLAPVFGALFVIVLRDPTLAAGNEGLRTKAAIMGFSGDWPSFFNLIGQAIGIGGVIVFGFVASWIFGREFADRTIKDMLCLPVSRSLIVIAKLIITVFWCFLIAVSVTLVALVIGWMLGLTGWDAGVMADALTRVSATAILTVALCPPVAFVASIGRGYLAPLGYVIFTVFLAQIFGALGYGAYIPWAVPALFSGMGAEAGGKPDFVSYLILAGTSAAGVYATLHTWKYADQSL